MKSIAVVAVLCALAAVSGCSTVQPQPGDQGVFGTRDARPGGGFYKDDGPGTGAPDIALVPDAQPRAEPLHRFANNPYQVMGVTYSPMRTIVPFRQRGIASWYGRRFHGQSTSSGEKYDMYAMTAAHPTLPIPSYVKVTNLANGRSVVVRVNDRGPFLRGRIIDLSWTAAAKLGYVQAGSAQVEVELIQPQDFPIYARRAETTAVAAAQTRPSGRFEVVSSAQAAESTAGVPVYLQLGVFTARDNAEALLARVARELSWLKDFAGVEELKGSFRVHIGPYKNRADAASAAERVRESLQIAPVLVTR